MITDKTTGNTETIIITTRYARFNGLGSTGVMTMDYTTWLDVRDAWVSRYGQHADSVYVRDETDEERVRRDKQAKEYEDRQMQRLKLVAANREKRVKPAKYSPIWPSKHV